MTTATTPLGTLLGLAHDLGREDRKFSILGEGNVSTRLSDETFLVKASGSSLGTLTASQVTECRFDRLLPLLDAGAMKDSAIDAALLAARVDSAAPKPSTEAIFHAYLLTLPDVTFVGHTHPMTVNQLLCSRHGRSFARRRIFPDEIVCCGSESVYLPYTDPGLKLAQAMRRAIKAFVRRRGLPRVILLENHGFIALGATAASVLATTMMASKAADIFQGTLAGGGPRFLTPAAVDRIAGRPDERHRQRVLGLSR